MTDKTFMPNAFCFVDRISEIDIHHMTAIYPTAQIGGCSGDCRGPGEILDRQSI